MENLEYSVTVPVYNEQDNLGELADNIKQAMSKLDKPWEAILVDDGSHDDSRRIIKEICEQDPHFRYLFFDHNHGQTAAFDAGFKSARGRLIITMDADLQVDANDIPKLLEKIDEYDAVVGYRAKRQDTVVKKLSSKIANNIRNKLSGESIRDTGCPLKIMKRECLSNVKLFKGMHRFFPTLIKMEGYTVTEVPVNHFPRVHGVSKYNISNRALRALLDLFAVRWMKKRYLGYKIIQDSLNPTPRDL